MTKGGIHRLFGVGFVFAVAALSACASDLSDEHRGGPEPVTLNQRPFPSFISTEEKAGRCLYADFMLDTNDTLSKPVVALEDFAQFEWFANRMKGSYLHLTPGMLERMLQSRDTIRMVMGVPADLSVGQAITNYAERSRNPGTHEGLFLMDHREALKEPMTKAGYAIRSYLDRHDEGSRDNEIFLPEGNIVGPTRWKTC